MFPLKTRPSPPGLSAGSVMFVSLTAVLLLLGRCCRGETQVITPLQPVFVMNGEDVVLPCLLDPAVDAVGMTFEWARLDLEPRFVHVWHDRKDLHVNQNPAYKGRTSVSVSRLSHGDISLALSKVTHSDNGRYRCYLPDVEKHSTVELVVGTASSPAISLAGMDRSSNGVILQCKSAGWYPEPEVWWLDGEGNLLSAEPTETERGPDGLYTVSSRVTVDKRHSNSFTCRVQQENINQTRETHILVPDDFFMAPPSPAAWITVSVISCSAFALGVVLVVWRWRQNRQKTTKRKEERLLAQKKKTDDLQRTEEEHKDIVNKLKKHVEQLTEQKTKVEEQVENTTEMIQSVSEKMEDDATRASDPEYLNLRDTMKKHKEGLNETWAALEKLELEAEKLLKKTEDVTERLKEIQKEAENHEDQE